jgi:hypothetical protein
MVLTIFPNLGIVERDDRSGGWSAGSFHQGEFVWKGWRLASVDVARELSVADGEDSTPGEGGGKPEQAFCAPALRRQRRVAPRIRAIDHWALAVKVFLVKIKIAANMRSG